MCLPLDCVKYVLSFFAFITILIGIAGLISGSIYWAKFSGHLDFDSFNPTTVSTILLLGTGVIAIFIGITGLVGAKKKSKCCLCIYQFSVFPLLVLSLAVAILATYATYMVDDMQEEVQDELSTCDWQKPTASCKKCGNTGILEWVQDINEGAFVATNDILGQLEDCQILSSEEDVETYKGFGYKYVTSDPETEGAVSNALDCKQSLVKQSRNAGNFLAYFEKEFKCSGMCAATPFFAFYDTQQPINNDIPSCYSKVAEFMDNDVVVAISWSVFSYFLLNVILACCVCCHPDKKDQDYKSVNGAYSRMNYYD